MRFEGPQPYNTTTSVDFLCTNTSSTLSHHLPTKHRTLEPVCPKGSNTLESFLSIVAFESNLRKKLSRIEHVLILKVSFERRKIANVFMTHVQDFFQKRLLKENFLVCHYLKHNCCTRRNTANAEPEV